MAPAKSFPGAFLTEVSADDLVLADYPVGRIFLAIAGIPLWIVISHLDYRQASTDAADTGNRAQAAPVTVAGMADRPTAPSQICDRREHADASAGDRG